jgi:hypothetical protein
MRQYIGCPNCRLHLPADCRTYVSMDVCVDLTTKLVHKHGQPMLKEYGNSWVYVYLPETTLEKFKSYVKTGTGWDVPDEGTVYDPNRKLVAIEAKMHHESGQPSQASACGLPGGGSSM